MKRVVSAVVALLVLAWPTATWWMGKQIEARLAEQYKALAQMPFIKVVKRDFQRGFASSTDDVIFEVFGDMFRRLAKVRDAQGNAAEVPQPLRFTVKSRVDHGPIVGGGLSAAVVDSEFVLDDESMRELAKVLGDKKPLTARTVFGFDGGGRSTVESPAFTHRFIGPDGAAAINWGGVKADTTFTRDMAGFTLVGEVPRLEVQDEGVHMLISGIRMSGNQKRLFADEPMFYSGTQKFDIAQIDIKPAKAAALLADGDPVAPLQPVTMKNLTYAVDMPVTGGDFIDVVTRISAVSILVGQQEFGPAHFDVSTKHLHARTVAKVYHDAMQMYADPQVLADKLGTAVEPLKNKAMGLLAHHPEFSVDRLAFTSPHGQSHVAARVKLTGVKPEDLSMGLGLLTKLDATADLKLPEALLADLGGANAQSPQDKQMVRQMFSAQVDGLAQQGYVTRTNGILEFKLALSAGQLTINGKPFDPQALGLGAAPVSGKDAHAKTTPAQPRKPVPRK